MPDSTAKPAFRPGDRAILTCRTFNAEAGSIVKIMHLVPMHAGRAWYAVQPAPGAPACIVPPEHLRLPEGAASEEPPSARQLSLLDGTPCDGEEGRVAAGPAVGR